MSTLVRDRDGEMVASSVLVLPVHHRLRDGHGRTRAQDPADAVPVLCRACRPVAVAARERAARQALIGARRG